MVWHSFKILSCEFTLSDAFFRWLWIAQYFYLSNHRTMSFPTGSWGNPNPNGQIVREVVLGFLFFLWHFAWFLNFSLISLKLCLLFLLPQNTYHEPCHYLTEKKKLAKPLDAFYNLSDETLINFTPFFQAYNSALQGFKPLSLLFLFLVILYNPLHPLKLISNITSSAKPARELPLLHSSHCTVIVCLHICFLYWTQSSLRSEILSCSTLQLPVGCREVQSQKGDPPLASMWPFRKVFLPPHLPPSSSSLGFINLIYF